jgi:hypothetical protein
MPKNDLVFKSKTDPLAPTSKEEIARLINEASRAAVGRHDTNPLTTKTDITQHIELLSMGSSAQTAIPQPFQSFSATSAADKSAFQSKALAGLFQQGVGASLQYSAGAGLADFYNGSANQSYALANYNIGLQRLQHSRQVFDLQRSLQKTLGRQKIQFASRGISSTSKSALMLANEALDTFDMAINNSYTDLQIKEDQIQFQAQQAAADSQRRAAAAQAQGASGLTSLIGPVMDFASSAFGKGGASSSGSLLSK